jgi:hypothetical protein
VKALWSVGAGGGAERVKITDGVTSEENRPRVQILDGESKCIKFHGDIIITSKSSNGN